MRPPAKISVLFPEDLDAALQRLTAACLAVDPPLKQSSPLPHHLQFRQISLTAIADVLQHPEESPTARSFGEEILSKDRYIGGADARPQAVHPREAAREAAEPSERPQGWERPPPPTRLLHKPCLHASEGRRGSHFEQLRRIESSRKQEKRELGIFFCLRVLELICALARGSRRGAPPAGGEFCCCAPALQRAP